MAGILQKIKTKAKPFVPNKLLSMYHGLHAWFQSRRRLRPRKMLQFSVHLTEQCNLNCKYCAHFSPLAEKEFIDIKVFERDFARLAELTGGRVEKIVLLGGEPLLHPDINSLLYIARKHFPWGLITLNTNGLLLPKQTGEFWEACRKNNIEIWITKYPIKSNIDSINELRKTYGGLIRWFGEEIKTMWKVPLDCDGKQNNKESFMTCTLANWCISLENGKLFTCATIPYIRHFNKYFTKSYNVSEKDFIDIYKANDIHEILNFLCKPVPFCRYCNFKGIVRDLEWGISKRDISEWT